MTYRSSKWVAGLNSPAPMFDGIQFGLFKPMQPLTASSDYHPQPLPSTNVEKLGKICKEFVSERVPQGARLRRSAPAVRRGCAPVRRSNDRAEAGTRPRRIENQPRRAAPVGGQTTKGGEQPPPPPHGTREPPVADRRRPGSPTRTHWTGEQNAQFC